MNVEARVEGYRAVAQLYNALMTGLVLTLVTRKGEEEAAAFVKALFRRQHLEKFLPGLRKLGLEGLPHAVACAQYHYLSNALGGVKTEFIPESDRKAWVRYPPPRWIWQGTAICGIPVKVNAAMLHGWHGHNGVSLGNPHLGFVCTAQTVEGAPGLEGYYVEYDRDIAPEERVRFVSGERAPDFDPAKAPRLDGASWPQERLKKVERSYAMEYVRSLAPTMLALFGEADTRDLLGTTARLIGMQYYDDTRALLGHSGREREAFANYLADMAAAQGESVSIHRDGGSFEVRQQGWKLMQGLGPLPSAISDAWNELWRGALSVHDRKLKLEFRRGGDAFVWRISETLYS